MKKILIILLSLFSLVGVGFAAWTVYDKLSPNDVIIVEQPEVGPFSEVIK